MFIYYLIWGIVSILSITEVLVYRNKCPYVKDIKNINIWLIWCIFTFVVCFKGAVGTDYYSYQQMFQSHSTLEGKGIEPLFKLWIKTISLFTSYFPIFWLITGFFNISIKFYVIKYLSPFVSVSILIYLVGLFFERDFDGIRQGISIGLGYLACVMYLREESKYKYIATIICATCFHYTSFLFLLIPILAKVHLTNKWVYILLAFGLFCVFTKLDLLKLLFDIVGYNNWIYDKMYNYLTSETYSKSVGINIGLIFRLVILILFLKLRHLIPIPEKQYYLLFNGFFLAILISLLFNNIEILSHRLAYGFREFQIFIIPYLILTVRGYYSKILVTIVICLYSFILLNRLLNTPHLMDYYHYETIFN